MEFTELKTPTLQESTHAAIETFYKDFSSLKEEKQRLEEEISTLVSELFTAGKTVTLGPREFSHELCKKLCNEILEPKGITLTVTTVVKNVGSILAPVSAKFSTFTSVKKSS